MVETSSLVGTASIEQHQISPEALVMDAIDSRRLSNEELAEITGISPEEAERMSIDAQFLALMYNQYCEWPAGEEVIKTTSFQLKKRVGL